MYKIIFVKPDGNSYTFLDGRIKFRYQNLHDAMIVTIQAPFENNLIIDTITEMLLKECNSLELYISDSLIKKISIDESSVSIRYSYDFAEIDNILCEKIQLLLSARRDD